MLYLGTNLFEREQVRSIVIYDEVRKEAKIERAAFPSQDVLDEQVNCKVFLINLSAAFNEFAND